MQTKLNQLFAKLTQETTFKRMVLLSTTLALATLIFIKINSSSSNSLATKSQEMTFSGVTHVNINRTIRNLHLTVMTQPEDHLQLTLKHHNLSPVSSFFKDAQYNIALVITRPASGLTSDKKLSSTEPTEENEDLLFSVIKDGKLIQNQKITSIEDNKINLRYGYILLDAENSELPLRTASENPTDIF